MFKKKSLGQHFLKNPYYLGLVADAAEITKGETVVEVGPGEGTLTKVLLERGARVIVLEKDHRLIPQLEQTFAGKDVEIIEGDALEFDTAKLGAYKVVGNIPYYISGALFRKFLENAHQPSALVFLIQKEVAERIARDEKESILSLSIKAYGEPRYVRMVPRGAFNPPPLVDSAVLAVQNISRKNFKDAPHEKKFFELVKKGFGKKRKLLKSNLEMDAETLTKAGIPEQARAEDVALAQWLALSRD